MTPDVFHALSEYRAVVVSPEEDTPRLMLADWLEEHCGEDGDFRAKYIRLAVEVSQRPDLYDGTEAGAEARMLLAVAEGTYGSEWRRGSVCDNPYCYEGRHIEGFQPETECARCFGSGDAGGLLRRFEYDANNGHGREQVRVTFARGFPDRVEVPSLSDCVEEVPQDPRQGLGPRLDQYKTPAPLLRPSRWLAQVLAAHPATRVVPLDRNPGYLQERDSFLWFRSASPQMPSEIHPEIWDRVVLPKEGTFRSDTDAIEALGLAIAKWGRAAL